MSDVTYVPGLRSGKPGHRSALSILYHDAAFRAFFCIVVPKIILFNYLSYRGSMSWLQFLISFPPTFGVVLVLLSVSLLIENNILKLGYLFWLDLVLSFLFLFQSIYFKYFGDFASLYQLGEIRMLAPLWDAVKSITGKEILFIADLPFWPVLASRLKKGNNHYHLGWIRWSSVFLLAGLLLNTVALLGNHFYGGQIESVYERKETVRLMGLPTYQISDAVNYFITEAEKHSVSRADISRVADWFQRHRRQEQNGFTRLGKGLNLIIIQVESLQNFVIGRRINGREITPNLNRLAEKGIYFDRIYDQTAAGNTSDATFLANCSLYPSSRGAVSFLYPQDSFQCLPRILRKYGYSTATMHAYDKTYWNRETFEKTEGFAHQFYGDTYVMTDRLGWGLSDHAFFAQSMGKIKKLHPPFFAYLTTLTSHTPFDDVTPEIDDFPVGNLGGRIIDNYIRAMHYVDGAIGSFLLELDRYNLTSNTVIVIFGDHRARLPEEDIRMAGVHDMSETRKIPLIIAFPGANLKSHVIGGLIDVAPTLLNILGIDSSETFFMGRDLLKKANAREGGFVIFRDGSSISDDKTIDGAAAGRRLMISDMIMKEDLIPALRRTLSANSLLRRDRKSGVAYP